MTFFNKNQGVASTFGKNEYLGSTKQPLYLPYTFAANSMPTVTDPVSGTLQKILQPGTVLAKITSGPDSGKVGVYQAAGTADVWTVTPSGTWSGGTYTLTVNGKTTAVIAYNAAISVVQAALDALLGSGAIVVSGGPQYTTATVYTAGGNTTGPVALSITTTSVTGSTPAAAAVHTTTGIAGAIDGRSSTSNIVGINDTFLPWQLLEGDEQVSVLYDGVVVQGWCIEYTAPGVQQACQNATATAMSNQKSIDIRFP